MASNGWRAHRNDLHTSSVQTARVCWSVSLSIITSSSGEICAMVWVERRVKPTSTVAMVRLATTYDVDEAAVALPAGVGVAHLCLRQRRGHLEALLARRGLVLGREGLDGS